MQYGLFLALVFNVILCLVWSGKLTPVPHYAVETARTLSPALPSIYLPTMIRIEAGKFRMGSDEGRISEAPAHEVTLAAFYLAETETTFNQYDAFALATHRELPYDGNWGRGEYPVINISWEDAQDYANWLSTMTGVHYRLPSEAEWEYAAHGGENSDFSWGHFYTVNAATCLNCGNAWDGLSTRPSHQFPPNQYGIYDMHGNVQEWNRDCWHDNYLGAPNDGSAWANPACMRRVIRGGSWATPVTDIRAGARSWQRRRVATDRIGFRVAHD